MAAEAWAAFDLNNDDRVYLRELEERVVQVCVHCSKLFV
jgi:hypothetical protein